MLRLSEKGTLFLYDMERISPPELGAVPWSAEEVLEIMRTLGLGLGAPNFKPEVGRWPHSRVTAWDVLLKRQQLGIFPVDTTERREAAVLETERKIIELLTHKLTLCQRELEAITVYGAGTPEEENDKERLLFEFWAISRALGAAS